MTQLDTFIGGRKPVSSVDQFAGSGGISENCELTHRVRYNVQKTA